MNIACLLLKCKNEPRVTTYFIDPIAKIYLNTLFYLKRGGDTFFKG